MTAPHSPAIIHPAAQKAAEKREAYERRCRSYEHLVEVERSVSQVSSTIMLVGDMLDDWMPFGMARAIARRWVHRRAMRKVERAARR